MKQRIGYIDFVHSKRTLPMLFTDSFSVSLVVHVYSLGLCLPLAHSLSAITDSEHTNLVGA